jgi:hypothetical protein
VNGAAAEAEAATAAASDADIQVQLSVAAASNLENMLDWSVLRGTCDLRQILASVFRDAEDRSEDEVTPRDEIEVDSGTSNGAGCLAGEQRVLESTDEIPTLVQRFFGDAHTKNPILDDQILDPYSEIERDGFRWNGKSCLVVLHILS